MPYTCILLSSPNVVLICLIISGEMLAPPLTVNSRDLNLLCLSSSLIPAAFASTSTYIVGVPYTPVHLSFSKAAMEASALKDGEGRTKLVPDVKQPRIPMMWP
uniref:Uncharacterized protein n=1 Tax=Cacopsylla melanoneura TaxID=428564 RepID=A0A8D8LPL8_9HEMI